MRGMHTYVCIYMCVHVSIYASKCLCARHFDFFGLLVRLAVDSLADNKTRIQTILFTGSEQCNVTCIFADFQTVQRMEAQSGKRVSSVSRYLTCHVGAQFRVWE